MPVSIPTDGGGSSVVCVELLDVGHGEVGLQTDGAAEVHYRLVRLVYQQVDLHGDTLLIMP